MPLHCTSPSWGPSSEVVKVYLCLLFPHNLPPRLPSHHNLASFSPRIPQSLVPNTLHPLIIHLALKGQ